MRLYDVSSRAVTAHDNCSLKQFFRSCEEEHTEEDVKSPQFPEWVGSSVILVGIGSCRQAACNSVAAAMVAQCNSRDEIKVAASFLPKEHTGNASVAEKST